jgi:hypothetical protein
LAGVTNGPITALFGTIRIYAITAKRMKKMTNAPIEIMTNRRIVHLPR